jgi:MoaA/NifB/PqqE/SkfB family radical SAM enzyme
LDNLVGLSARYGAKLRVSRFRPSGRGKQSWAELNVEREQMAEFSQWLARHLAVSTGDSFFSVTTEERRSLGLNMCGACKLTCCLSPQGEIYPCAFLQVFDSFRQLEIKSCESCQRFDMCHGGCPAIAYHTQRKLGLPDPGCLANCVTMKAVMRDAV